MPYKNKEEQQKYYQNNKNKYLCEHNKNKYECKICNSTAFCIHNKRHNKCRDCNGKLYYTNFQPLLINDNLSKYNKWSIKDKIFWNVNIKGKEFYSLYYPS